MQSSPLKLSITLSCILLFCFGTAAQQTLVSLYNNSIELNGSERINKQTIPLKLGTGISFEELNIEHGRLKFIRLDNKYEKSYLEGFKVTKANNETPSLEIVADLDILKTAGTYEGIIVFTAKDKREEISISIIRPAVKLESVGAVHILMEGNEIEKADPLILKETGKKSNLTQLKLTSPFFTSINKDNLISFPKNPYTINAGSVSQIIYNPSEKEIRDIPLGKHAGKMEITSPELTNPLVVDFEIIHKRSNWWIILIIFVGVLYGAFVRNFIKNRKELAQKRTEAFQLLDNIENDIRAIEDKNFIDQVMIATNELRSELGKKTSFWQIRKDATGTLTSLIEKTTTQYNEKKTAFEATTKTTVEELNLFSQLFDYDDLVPEITRALGESKSLYNLAKADVLKRDITSANRNIHLIKNKINKFIEQYAAALGNTLATIEAGKAFPDQTPVDVKDVLKQKSVNIKTVLQEVKESQDDTGKLVISVNEADSVQSNVNQLLNTLKEKIYTLFQNDYKPDDSELMKKFSKNFEAWQASVQKTKDDPLIELDTAPLQELNSTWAKVKESQPAETRLSEGKASMPSVNRNKIELPWQGRTVISRGSNFIDISFKNGSIGSAIKDANRNLLMYSIIQTVFVFALLALAAYKFYAPNFIGTFDEIIALFLVAFSMDVTVDSVIQLRDKKG